jgi:hypothetical protein
MHDRIIGALETCCRRGEMLRIQNRNVDWERHQIAFPGRHAKNAENRRIPFDPHGRLAPILKRRAALGPSAYVFGSPAREFVANFKTAWESLLLVANGQDTKRPKPGARVDREKLRQIDVVQQCIEIATASDDTNDYHIGALTRYRTTYSATGKPRMPGRRSSRTRPACGYASSRSNRSAIDWITRSATSILPLSRRI